MGWQYTASMKPRVFNRSILAREHLELFLISAIGSLLAIRALLHLTGYPQLGGGGFHIAHMLYGDILMGAADVLMLAFIGARVQRLAALIGGIGFGAFIDELGKFITSDNDYFFQPAIGLIYAIFVILYLTFNFLGRQQRLTSREYQLNALTQLEEAIVHDLEPTEKMRALALLRKADQKNPITQQLQSLVENVNLVPEDEPRRITKLLHKLDTVYTRFWRRRGSNPAVRIFFILESVIFVMAVSVGIFKSLNDVLTVFHNTPNYEVIMVICQTVSSLVAAGFAVVGALLLTRSRAQAFEQFRRATLINLFLTEFFLFSRVEFRALPGFIYNLVILSLVTYIIHLERRSGARVKSDQHR